MIAEPPDEYEKTIHQDVRSGYLTSVRAYLRHKPECVNKRCQYEDFQWTLLFAACHYQHEAIVQLLVTEFQADVEAENTIPTQTSDLDAELMPAVSPLYIAVVMNNLKIVRFLVEYGLANVNHLTKGHASPLRAACANGNREIVQYLIQYGADPHQTTLTGSTNLMLIVLHEHVDLLTLFVDTIKCNLNEQDNTGRSALHIAAGGASAQTVRFLLNCGALNFRDRGEKLTPLMLAAIRGSAAIVAAFGGHCSDLEWIEAHELLGSAYVVCAPGMENMNLAVEHFTLAYQVRATKHVSKTLSDESLEVFGHRRECRTLEELNQLISLNSREAFYFEALLIQKRLLGVTNANYHQSIRQIIKQMMDRNQYAGCLQLWLYELELRREHGVYLDAVDLRSIARLCLIMVRQGTNEQFFRYFRRILTIMQEELSSVPHGACYDLNLSTVLCLVTASASLLLDPAGDGDRKLQINDRKALFGQVRMIVKQKYTTVRSGSSLLHLCCDSTANLTTYGIEYPCLLTARLLVLCDIDVDATDFRGNTALHILVRTPSTDSTLATLHFLCDRANAHLDFADDQGYRPIELCHSTLFKEGVIKRQLQKKQNVTSLKCRCARQVKYSRIPYKEYLSSALVNFVHKH